MLSSCALLVGAACGRVGYETLDERLAATDGVSLGGAPPALSSTPLLDPIPLPPVMSDPQAAPTGGGGGVAFGDAPAAAGQASSADAGTEVGDAGVMPAAGDDAGSIAPRSPGAVGDGLVAWFDAADQGFNDGAAVGDWHGAQQADPDAMPTYVADGLNGHPVIRFDGVNDILQVQDFSGLTDYDVFAVWQSPIVPATNEFTHILRHGTEDTENFELTFSSPFDIALHAAGFSSAGEWVLAQFDAPTPNTPYLWNSTYDSTLGDLTARSNGVVITVHDGEPRLPDVGEAVLGLGGRPGPDRFFTGDIAEIVIYDRALDTTERDLIQRYLADKWGLSVP